MTYLISGLYVIIFVLYVILSFNCSKRSGSKIRKCHFVLIIAYLLVISSMVIVNDMYEINYDGQFTNRDMSMGFILIMRVFNVMFFMIASQMFTEATRIKKIGIDSNKTIRTQRANLRGIEFWNKLFIFACIGVLIFEIFLFMSTLAKGWF